VALAGPTPFMYLTDIFLGSFFTCIKFTVMLLFRTVKVGMFLLFKQNRRIHRRAGNYITPL
jgi:hypothetical protein